MPGATLRAYTIAARFSMTDFRGGMTEESGRDRDGAADVVIVGGGPAGAAAGRLLAAWGHAVLLLTRSDTAAPSLAESLPPSCRKVFEAVGVREAIDAAGFVAASGNTVCWGGGPPRVARFGGGQVGHQVLRRDFDRLLLAEARRAGAVVRTGVTVRDVQAAGEAAAGEAGGRVTFAGRSDQRVPGGLALISGRDERGGPVTAAGRVVLDCSGRSGVVARRHRTRVQAGETTLALVGIWSSDDGWPSLGAAAGGDGRSGAPGDGAQTIVEAYADGWAWSVPVSDRQRYVTVMVDPRTTRTDHPGSLAARYAAEIRKTRHLARMTGGAVLDRPPWARDASQYGAARFGGPGFLLVGDAATFIDPLSSFGVKKAMASGWLAAVVTNTCLRRPDRAALARRFHAGREQEMWSAYRRQAAAFFAQVSRRELHPFWSDRADPVAPATVLDRTGGADAVEALRADPAVRDAFEALRRAPAIHLRRTAAARARTAPAVEGREVVPAACLTIDLGEAGTVDLRYLRGVDLPALAAMADRRTQAPDLYEAYNEAHPPVALADFLGALAVLLGKGLLRNAV